MNEIYGFAFSDEMNLFFELIKVALGKRIPAGQWHTVKALESGTVILEMKNGAYEPLSDVDILK